MRTEHSLETRKQLATMAMWDRTVPDMPVSFGAPSPTLGKTIFNGLLFNLLDADIYRFEQFRPVELNELPGDVKGGFLRKRHLAGKDTVRSACRSQPLMFCLGLVLWHR